MDGSIKKAEAGPILSLLRLLLISPPTLYVHSIYSCVTILYTDQPIPTIVVFLCECTIYDWLYMGFVCRDLEEVTLLYVSFHARFVWLDPHRVVRTWSTLCHLTVHLSPKAYGSQCAL